MWQPYYEDRLQDWISLRDESKKLASEYSFQLIHDWWQTAPTILHYLHMDDYKTWPGPWELLANNNFCEVAKAAGIMYTIILTERPEIYSMSLLQDDNYTYVQVLTDGGEYLLNGPPGSIKASTADVNILHKLDCNYFKNKLI